MLHPPTPALSGESTLQPFEHELAAIAVLHIGAGDRYGQDQTQYIDHNVPLTTLGVFTGIVAPIAPFCWVATLWLLYNCCARTNMPAFANAYLIPELIVNPVAQSGEPPKAEVVIDRLPVSELTRQYAPTDAAL